MRLSGRLSQSSVLFGQVKVFDPVFFKMHVYELTIHFYPLFVLWLCWTCWNDIVMRFSFFRLFFWCGFFVFMKVMIFLFGWFSSVLSHPSVPVGRD